MWREGRGVNITEWQISIRGGGRAYLLLNNV
jgi:hypothetical protein